MWITDNFVSFVNVYENFMDFAASDGQIKEGPGRQNQHIKSQ